MNFVFLTDPPGTFHTEKDTSYVMMLAAFQRGHCVYQINRGEISIRGNQPLFHGRRLEVSEDETRAFHFHDTEEWPATKTDALFIRTDPPFDENYLTDTWLADLLPPESYIMNSPRGLRTVNEKIWAAGFGDLVPPTLISRQWPEIREFAREQGEIILKPVDGFGGSGVFRLRSDDSNLAVTWETLSDRGRRYLIVQKFIPEAREGDKRILLLGGEVLGTLKRVHGKEDHRNNFAAGGKAQAAELTARDREIIGRLREPLRQLDLDFVGLDIIGEHLIEVNVTSPTTVREMNKLYGVKLEEKIISFAEEKVTSRKRGVSR